MQGRKLTNVEKTQFLKKLVLTGGNVSKACRVVKISRGAAYSHKEDDKAFSDAWDEAIAAGVEDLEEEVRRRAFKGVNEPVFQGGKKVGYIRRYSDRLLMFLVKRHKPEYREQSTYDVNLNFTELSDAELEAIAKGEKP